MNEARLLRLADLLERDAANPKGVRFDLATWGKREKDYIGAAIPVDCGTTACAVGLACISGDFASEGLTYATSRTHPELKFHYDKTFEPIYDGLEGFHAVTAFFELSGNDACYLFSEASYQDELWTTYGRKAQNAVVERIRKFVGGTRG